MSDHHIGTMRPHTERVYVEKRLLDLIPLAICSQWLLPGQMAGPSQSTRCEIFARQG